MDEITLLKQRLDEAENTIRSLTQTLEDMQIQIEPYRALLVVKNSFVRVLSNNTDFQLRLPNLAADPAVGYAGALAVVGGKLKVYTGGAWVVVGTQT